MADREILRPTAPKFSAVYSADEQMQRFTVSIRSLGSRYLVNVEGRENANWLLSQLSRQFVFRSAEPIREDRESLFCTFDVPYNSRLPVRQFRQLLEAIPEVRLTSE